MKEPEQDQPITQQQVNEMDRWIRLHHPNLHWLYKLPHFRKLLFQMFNKDNDQNDYIE